MGNPEKFAQGHTVADVLVEHRIPANLATYILIECAKALREASEKGVLHQNIKPNHILISKAGKVRLIKFSNEAGKSGAARLLKSALPYSAPERLAGASPSVSSDIFALGASFFEVLTGERAFKGATGQEIKQKVLNYDPTPQLHEEDHVHTQLRRICQQLLRKKPQQRYQGYKVLLSDLEAYKKNRGLEAVGSAIEMKRFLDNPGSYVSPERKDVNNVRARVRSGSGQAEPVDAQRKETTSKDSQPQLSRMFLVVGVLVLLFSGLSIAGNFFFNKDGKWGANGASSGVRTPSSQRSSTVTTRRGSGEGNAAVQATGSSTTSQDGGAARVVGESDPVEIIDQTEGESGADNDTTVLSAVSLAGVDTVIILPDEKHVRTGRLMIKSTPTSFVLFQGDSLGKTPLPVITNPGTYKIELKAPGFPSFETVVDVVPDRETPVDVSLWILVGRLDLDINPAAEVYIDDELRGRSLAKKSLPVLSGKHRLTLVHPEFGTFESEFEIAAGDIKVLRFNLADME